MGHPCAGARVIRAVSVSASKEAITTFPRASQLSDTLENYFLISFGSTTNIMSSNKKKSDRSSSFTFKKNGDKGAEAHTVSEQTRIRFTKMLMDMRESDTIDQIEMPPDLTNTERKFIHLLAGQLGLKSKSSGKGDNRRITISKIKDLKSTGDLILDMSTMPQLRLGPAGAVALELHLQKFPPSPLEMVESSSTESTMIDNFALDITDEEDDAPDAVDEVLLTEGLDSLHIHSEKPSPLDVAQRTQWHHEAQRLKVQKPRFNEMQSARAKLPAYAYREEICAAVRNHRIILISGDTGWCILFLHILVSL